MIINFWKNKSTYKDIETLKSKFIEAYTEDFTNPDRFNVWKLLITDLNEIMYSNLEKLGFDLTNWKDISYDQFCNLLIKNAVEFITDHNEIIEEDMIIINESVIRDYAMSLDIKRKERKEKIEISDIINSIKMKAR